jgi:dipeptidyl aminopeptidase/acylaminoacyl peptidase
MDRDIREDSLYRKTEELLDTLRSPGSGRIVDAAEVSAISTHATFAGTLVDTLNGSAPTRICVTDLVSGDTRVLTFGPNVDHAPAYSPDGTCIAFLSDRHRLGDFQLYLLNPVSGDVRPAPRVTGWVEYLRWSPDGRRILLGVAGHGADLSGIQGAIRTPDDEKDIPSWMPRVEGEVGSFEWRRLWVYELETDVMRSGLAGDQNVWEAAWCGVNTIACVISPDPAESAWYTARLSLLDLGDGTAREIYNPSYQIGVPAGSPSGEQVAIIEAVCSDRFLVAGDLHLVDINSGGVRNVDTHGVDVTYLEWRSSTKLLVAGHRGFETVIGLYELTTHEFTESWSSTDITTSGRYAIAAGLGDKGDCVMIAEGFVRAPEIGVIRSGQYVPLKSLNYDYAETFAAVTSIEPIRWLAPDGLEIQGWLLLPLGKGPHPVVMNVHGGPVWAWRQLWLGRGGGILTLMLLKRGFAVFLPNPRGSTGRGQEFVRRVVGDVGGADTQDYLSGLDALVQRGIADPHRLGVTGLSHGGYISAWLITQDNRFAAAVPVGPITNYVTEQLISNIPGFVQLFLQDLYYNPNGAYFTRSPVMHAHRAKTPTLNICGALDRCTPPEEAVQFHRALVQHGVPSALVIYPEEGHGIRRAPALIDYIARVVSWFERYMPPTEGSMVAG